MGSPNAANVYLKETISSVVLNLCQSILVVASPQPSAASVKLAPAFSLELAKVNNKQLLAIRARAAEASNVTRQGKPIEHSLAYMSVRAMTGKVLLKRVITLNTCNEMNQVYKQRKEHQMKAKTYKNIIDGQKNSAGFKNPKIYFIA